MKRVVLISVLSLLLSCIPKSRETELLKEIESLTEQLDDCENGPEKLLSKIKYDYENGKYEACHFHYVNMKTKHSTSELFSEVEKYYNLSLKKLKEIELEKEKEKQARLASLKKLKKNFDDVSGITWYKNPYVVHYSNTNLTTLYIGEEDNSVWLRLMMSYTGDDWIFFTKAYLSYDENTKEIYFDEYKDKKSDHDGGNVWEWIDVSIDKDTEKFLREFANSSKAKMRLSGKYTKTRTLTWKERQGIKDVLNGYETLKSEK